MENKGKNRRGKGLFGEGAAAKHLIRQGFKIVERGFRCRLGEIDLIAVKGGELYFVEVKTRWSADYGSPFEAIDERKQRQIKRVAEFYLALPSSSRYECCHLSAISVDMTGNEIQMEFIADAFEA